VAVRNVGSRPSFMTSRAVIDLTVVSAIKRLHLRLMRIKRMQGKRGSESC